MLLLYEGALENISGYVIFSNDLEATQEEIEEFDKRFPYRKRDFKRAS